MSDTLDALQGALRSQLLDQIATATDLAALDAVRVSALGKKGAITDLMKGLGGLTPDERREAGQKLNALKDEIAAALDARKGALEAVELEARLAREGLDMTLPARPQARGRIHPISQVVDELTAIFSEMGFSVAEGPEIETGWHNFSALNIPPHHPARQMHDTFYLPDQDGAKDADHAETVLRTHTSPVQIRTMLEEEPPIRIIVPGRTYRSDYDMTHTPMFHQVEGLVIGRDITMGHLKGCLIEFCKRFFEVDDLPVRFRPSFFPFTEPSMEVDIGCSRKGGELVIGAGDDWLEILGSGMVHPQVLRNGGIDPDIYQGFAFGMGIERIAMLKYGIPDLRTFFEADVRWLEHYGFEPSDTPSMAYGLTK
jgi:phenylalanyl-tRNA synthetase alpha chain